MAIFHNGDASGSALAYRPITTGPIHHVAGDPSLATAGMRELGVAIALIGLGTLQG